MTNSYSFNLLHLEYQYQPISLLIYLFIIYLCTFFFFFFPKPLKTNSLLNILFQSTSNNSLYYNFTNLSLTNVSPT